MSKPVMWSVLILGALACPVATGIAGVSHSGNNPGAAKFAGDERPPSIPIGQHGSAQWGAGGVARTGDFDWGKQNYIEQTPAKATIKGKGKVSSSSNTMSRQKSQLYASHTSHVEITGPAGAMVHFSAANLIKLQGGFVITACQEGKITNSEYAIDILGTKHKYNLTVNSAGTSESTEGWSFTASAGASAHPASGKGGNGRSAKAVAGNAAGAEATATAGLSVTIESSETTTASAGANQSIEGVEFTKSFTEDGSVTYSKDLKIESFQRIDILVRAQGENPAFVEVEPYDVCNDVSFNYTVTNPFNNTTIESGGPIFACVLPDETPSTALQGHPGTALATNVVVQAIGLSNEDGAVWGDCLASLNGPAGEEIRFAVSADPSGSLSFPNGSSVVISEGEYLAHIPFMAVTSGSHDLVLTLLDAEGEPTSCQILTTICGSSTSSVAEPRVTASLGTDSSPWSGARVLPGATIPLSVVRSGFSDLETEETDVFLSIDDPDGIIQSYPASITIQEGDLASTGSIAMSGNPGTATITVNSGSQSGHLTLVSAPQSWSTVAGIRLPVGGRHRLTYEFSQGTTSDASVVVTSTLPGKVLVSAGSSATVLEGLNAGCAVLDGLEVGSSNIVLRTSGLSNLTVPVTVVGAELQITPSVICILGLDSQLSGTVHLFAPEGASFTGITLPSGYESYMAVSGEGTDHLAISIAAVSPLPSSAEIGFSFQGQAGVGDEVGVLDDYHGEGGVNMYQIEIED